MSPPPETRPKRPRLTREERALIRDTANACHALRAAIRPYVGGPAPTSPELAMCLSCHVLLPKAVLVQENYQRFFAPRYACMRCAALSPLFTVSEADAVRLQTDQDQWGATKKIVSDADICQIRRALLDLKLVIEHFPPDARHQLLRVWAP